MSLTLPGAEGQTPVAPAAGRLDDNLARGLVARVGSEVERLRGLSFKRRVFVSVVDDARLREYLLKQLRAFDQERHLQMLTQVYRLLGLIPADVDVLAVLLDAVEEQAGGFYDPVTGGYYLLADVPPDAAAMYTAHELTHALEDQHYDLDRNMREMVEDDDLAFATSAVQEGSATILMNLYMMFATVRGEISAGLLGTIAESEAGRAVKLAALPPVLLRQLLGPYVLGPRFLEPNAEAPSMNSKFPVAQVDQAQTSGPRSSEQILHPEKYWTLPRDVPRRVELGGAGKLLGQDFTLEGQGVLGEIALGPLVGAPTPFAPTAAEQPTSRQWTNAAAGGWGGDRFELWSAGGARVLLVLTVWDTPDDAREFAAALPQRPELTWRVARDRVALVAGPAGKDTSRVLSRMLKARLPAPEPH